MLSGVASPTLPKLLEEREVEKAKLEAQMASMRAAKPVAFIPPHPALLRLFEQKMGALREALNHETVRGEAAEILSTLIESVTIYPGGHSDREAEVVAKVADLMAFATNDKTAPKGGDL